MNNYERYQRLLQGSNRAIAILTLGLVLMTLTLLQSASAQTFIPLHQFSNLGEGENPGTGLTIDRAGNLYGTTYHAGTHSAGTVFEYSTTRGTFTYLYNFQGGMDGSGPFSRVVFGPDGTLYGTTWLGGGSGCGGSGCGTVYRLRPFPNPCRMALCSWMETVIYRFSGPDGATPEYGDLIFDSAGNIYGTSVAGGAFGDGAAYELSRSGNSWVETGLYSFPATLVHPWSGLTFDSTGNLYGTVFDSGTHNRGAIYQLTPSQSGWDENTIHNFTGMDDGGYVYAGLITDGDGNFYGATTLAQIDGICYGGTIFELSPSGDGWNFQTLYTFPPSQCAPSGPWGNLAFGPDHNLYGLTYRGGDDDYGKVFKLTNVNGTWMVTDLHVFTGTGLDGGLPYGTVVFDAAGNLFGTSSTGGEYGHGLLWEITPEDAIGNKDRPQR